MESLIHWVLGESGSAYIERFSKMFEKYTISEARSSGRDFYDEAQLKAWLPNGARVTDGLFALGSCNVLLECKSGLYNESVMTVGDNKMFSHKTRSLYDAALQGWEVAANLKNNSTAPSDVTNAATTYLLIITNKELSAGRGPMLAQMYPSGKFDPPDEVSAQLLPLEHIYVIHVEDFERMMGAVATGDLDLGRFLADCVAKDSAPQTMAFHLQQHLSGLSIEFRGAKLVRQAIDQSVVRLESILTG